MLLSPLSCMISVVVTSIHVFMVFYYSFTIFTYKVLLCDFLFAMVFYDMFNNFIVLHTDVSHKCYKMIGMLVQDG